MQTFAAAFAVFALVMLAMSVGVIFTGRFIREPCSAHANEGDEAGEHHCVCGASAENRCRRQESAGFVPVMALPADSNRPPHKTPVRGATSAIGA